MIPQLSLSPYRPSSPQNSARFSKVSGLGISPGRNTYCRRIRQVGSDRIQECVDHPLIIVGKVGLEDCLIDGIERGGQHLGLEVQVGQFEFRRQRAGHHPEIWRVHGHHPDTNFGILPLDRTPTKQHMGNSLVSRIGRLSFGVLLCV